MIKEFLLSQGHSDTLKAMFGDKQTVKTIEKYCRDPQNKKDKITNIENNHQIELRKKIRLFVMTGKTQEATALLEEHFPDLWNNNMVI